MKANELRIGNWVTTRRGYSQVTDIRAFDNQSISYNYKNPDGEIFNTACQLDEANPIPLTEDILLKCGFERKPDIDSNFDGGSHIEVFNHVESGFEMSAYLGDFKRCNIYDCSVEFDFSYLHLLQNAFSLTGKELKIEL